MISAFAPEKDSIKSEKSIDILVLYCYNIKAACQQRAYGGIAQLGERLNGIQEVSGSIPLISTKEVSKS